VCRWTWAPQTSAAATSWIAPEAPRMVRRPNMRRRLCHVCPCGRVLSDRGGGLGDEPRAAFGTHVSDGDLLAARRTSVGGSRARTSRDAMRSPTRPRARPTKSALRRWLRSSASSTLSGASLTPHAPPRRGERGRRGRDGRPDPPRSPGRPLSESPRHPHSSRVVLGPRRLSRSRTPGQAARS